MALPILTLGKSHEFNYRPENFRWSVAITERTSFYAPGTRFFFISFRDVKFNAGQILGLPVPDFERLSRDLTAGFIVSKEDFDEVLANDLNKN